MLLTRAETAGAITAGEATAVRVAHELTAKVIRVDDFAQDLGASEMKITPGAASIVVPTAVVHKAAA